MSSEVSRAREDGPLRPDGRLGDVVVGDGRVLLDGELELDASRVFHEPVELGQLLLGVLADLIADLDVPALHLETHGPRNLSDGTREGDDLDAARPGLAEGRGGC